MLHGQVRHHFMHRVEGFIARLLGMRLVWLHPQTGDLLLDGLPHVPEECPVCRGHGLVGVARGVHVVHGLDVSLAGPCHAGLVEAGEWVWVGEHDGVVRGGVVEAGHLPPEEEVPGVCRVMVRLGVGQVVALLGVGGVGELQAGDVAGLHEGVHGGHGGGDGVGWPG